MQSTLLIFALCLAILSYASEFSHTKRNSGILRLPATAVNRAELPSKFKRQDDVSLMNFHNGTSYMINLSIGTPPQPITVQLDTGSPETWVNPECSTAGGRLAIGFCQNYPRYDLSKSTTKTKLGDGRLLRYGKGQATIFYYTDTFALGESQITDQQFGVANETVAFYIGIMGVGLGMGVQLNYSNIVDQLALQGVTNSRAFSLDLRGVDSPDGSIIFGGVDTKKYTGKLEKRPFVPYNIGRVYHYMIYMTSIGLTKPGGETKYYPLPPDDPQGQPVVLDSGGTLSRLPTAIFNAMLPDFPNATLIDPLSKIYQVDCSVLNQPGTVEFGFGNTTIHVPYHEFVWAAGPDECALGIIPDDTVPVLGDTFLRAAYVVFDQENKNLHVANAANCGTNLIAIGNGPDAVPSVTGECGPSSTSSSISKPTSSQTAPSSTTPSPTSSQVTFKGGVGTVVVDSLAVLGAIFAALSLL